MNAMESTLSISSYHVKERRLEWSQPHVGEIRRHGRRRPHRSGAFLDSSLSNLLGNLPNDPLLARIAAMPAPRVFLEFKRSEVVTRLVRLLDTAPTAAKRTDQVLSDWFSEFRDGEELPQTEAVMVLLFALTRSSLRLGAELRDALRQTKRPELIRLKRFAESV
jgi:hypothetical protein